MSLVSYEPWSLLDKFQRQLNNLAYSDELFTHYDSDSLNMLTSGWRPAVDIREEKNRFLIVADVPGINPKDIEITMENGVLTVKGERHLDGQRSKVCHEIRKVYQSLSPKQTFELKVEQIRQKKPSRAQRVVTCIPHRTLKV